MKTPCRMLLLLSFLWLTACESVFVTQPLGDEVVVLEEKLWQGQWSNGEMVITTTIINAEKGILQAAWVERGQLGGELKVATGYVRRTGDVIYLNLPNFDSEALPDEDTGEAELPEALEYHWARLHHDGHRAILWGPDQNRFRDAVKTGTLPGSIKEDQDVLLGKLNEEHVRSINSPEANLLTWTEPLVFVRIGD